MLKKSCFENIKTVFQPVKEKFEVKMVRYCCVPQCETKVSKGKDTKIHLFPKDKHQRQQWIHKLRLSKPPLSKMIVCSLHFKESDYTLRGQGIINYFKST